MHFCAKEKDKRCNVFANEHLLMQESQNTLHRTFNESFKIKLVWPGRAKLALFFKEFW